MELRLPLQIDLYILRIIQPSLTSIQYIVSICSLFLLQVAVIVAIFFKIDWAQKLAKYIDAHHKKFQAFVIFHLKMCRLILITILVPQINVIVLAVLLWALGTETRTPRTYRKISGFNYSFLLRPNSPILDDSTQICRQCEVLSRGDQRRSFLAYFSGVFRRRSQGRIIIC
ncbi:hypothetical protein CJ030_MR8G027193 [Morella rubra]|uniref:Uncharacterized protein n=1 Tax=Morella rubra TaxID=262757 RepID=A0A6A1UZ86_9ROSI|nr:hypothetical protein CJ030_MR8G027193 [Morella rubra]